MVCVCAGGGLFGYDIGITGGVEAFEEFQRKVGGWVQHARLDATAARRRRRWHRRLPACPYFPSQPACLPASLLYLPFWYALPVLHPLPACLSDPACPQFFPDVYEAKYGPNAAANTDPYWWAPRGIGPTQPMHAAMMGVAG